MEDIKNAIIKNARIINAGHGCLTVWLQLDYGGSGQGFGGYNLHSAGATLGTCKVNIAGHFLRRVLEIAGVSEWDDLAGKAIRAKGGIDGVSAIGHIIKDDWFCPAVDLRTHWEVVI